MPGTQVKELDMKHRLQALNVEKYLSEQGGYI